MIETSPLTGKSFAPGYQLMVALFLAKRQSVKVILEVFLLVFYQGKLLLKITAEQMGILVCSVIFIITLNGFNKVFQSIFEMIDDNLIF